jgi:hypothetical protein
VEELKKEKRLRIALEEVRLRRSPAENAAVFTNLLAGLLLRTTVRCRPVALVEILDYSEERVLENPRPSGRPERPPQAEGLPHNSQYFRLELGLSGLVTMEACGGCFCCAACCP